MPILLIIVIILVCIIVAWQKKSKVNTLEQYTNMQEEQLSKNPKEEQNQNWKIEIPEISLIANISEGTEEDILKKYVGHFSITPKKEGNVGLAAHNRGYEINYFAKLKDLKGGEEIIYTYGEFVKTYVVDKNIKISETDWSYLENSNKNEITLITCIENEPEYRRCVQAVEKEETQNEKDAKNSK